MTRFKKYIEEPKRPVRLVNEVEVTPRMAGQFKKALAAFAFQSHPAFSKPVRIKIQEAIASGEWQAQRTAKSWAGSAVAAAIGADLKNASDGFIVKELLKDMLAKAELRTEQRPDAKGKVKDFIIVGQPLEGADSESWDEQRPTYDF